MNLVVSEVNACEYCLAAHTVIGGMVGFTPGQIIEICLGGASFDAKLDAIVVIGDKTVTNYLRGTTQVPVDFPAAPALSA